VHREVIEIRGAEPETIEVQWTIWGPVIDEDHLGRSRALRWTAHTPGSADLGLIGLETATTLEEALSAANRTGIPPQNFVCADTTGRIGWTIIGAIPVRRGFDGRTPTSWADGTRSWDGWLEPEAYPRIIDPEDGILWTANNRQVSGEMLAIVGDGGFDLGARAQQIRDGLLAIDEATETDMLTVQLDDRAVFLDRWRELVLELLAEDVVAQDPRRRQYRDLVRDTWTGRASVDSQAFRLVRTFRIETFEAVYGRLLAPLTDADERFSIYRFVQWEDSLWRLITERPEHFLGPDDESWEQVLLAAVDSTMDYFENEIGPDPELWSWGNRNTVRIRHPLSLAVPQLSGWLDIEPMQLPGASIMPRVQSPGFGASERFAVSPGREEEGYFHMPGGQSGHPLSPHYRAGHDAWVNGEPTSFLPGETATTLTLVPAGKTNGMSP
jgi:penicillin amidase